MAKRKNSAGVRVETSREKKLLNRDVYPIKFLTSTWVTLRYRTVTLIVITRNYFGEVSDRWVLIREISLRVRQRGSLKRTCGIS